MFSPRPHQTFHPDKVGLQCYSCGSLLNPDSDCQEFSRTEPSQVQTCLEDEACLMYSWRKSSTQTGKHSASQSIMVQARGSLVVVL